MCVCVCVCVCVCMCVCMCVCVPESSFSGTKFLIETSRAGLGFYLCVCIKSRRIFVVMILIKGITLTYLPVSMKFTGFTQVCLCIYWFRVATRQTSGNNSQQRFRLVEKYLWCFAVCFLLATGTWCFYSVFVNITFVIWKLVFKDWRHSQ